MSKPCPEPRPRPASQARLEANRRNAQHSTGPRTPEGKRASSANALKDGLRCEVIEPEEQRERIDARMAEWSAHFRPEDPAQAWYLRRAVAATVRLDLCLEAEMDDRRRAADRAGDRVLRESRARAGLYGQALLDAPGRMVAALKESAAGCEWLIAGLSGLARDLESPEGYLDAAERRRAVALLGLDPRVPSEGRAHPVAGPLLRAALAVDPAHPPEEADRWTGLDTAALGGPEARRAAHAAHLPTPEAARAVLLALLREQIDALETLRDERFEEVEGPKIAEARRRAGLLGGSKTTERLRRYESAHAHDLNRAMGTFLRLRREADPAPVAAEPDAWLDPHVPTDPVPEPADTPEAIPEPTPTPAPNEPNPTPADSPMINPEKDLRCKSLAPTQAPAALPPVAVASAPAPETARGPRPSTLPAPSDPPDPPGRAA
jgi:hypothetical protein